jgi:hypothetical protein
VKIHIRVHSYDDNARICIYMYILTYTHTHTLLMRTLYFNPVKLVTSSYAARVHYEHEAKEGQTAPTTAIRAIIVVRFIVEITLTDDNNCGNHSRVAHGCYKICML